MKKLLLICLLLVGCVEATEEMEQPKVCGKITKLESKSYWLRVTVAGITVVIDPEYNGGDSTSMTVVRMALEGDHTICFDGDRASIEFNYGEQNGQKSNEAQ